MPTPQKKVYDPTLNPISRDSVERIIKEDQARRVREKAEALQVKIGPAQGRPGLRSSEIYSRRKAATQEGSAR